VPNQFYEKEETEEALVLSKVKRGRKIVSTATLIQGGSRGRAQDKKTHGRGEKRKDGWRTGKEKRGEECYHHL